MTEIRVLSIILLSLSSSLDNFGVGVSYGLRNVCIPLYLNLFIAFVNSSGTLLAMLFGAGISHFIRPSIAGYAGAVLLIGAGAWVFFMELGKKRPQKTASPAMAGTAPGQRRCALTRAYHLVDDPFAAGLMCSGKATVREGLLLASALTLSNISTGIAAGMLGYSLALTTASAFIFNLLAISAGQRTGRFSGAGLIKGVSGVTSGLLLVAIGIYEIAG